LDKRGIGILSLPYQIYDRNHCTLHLPMYNGDFRDWSKDGNHGSSSDVLWDRWIGGQAPYFDGVSGKVDCGQDSSVDIADKHTIYLEIQFPSWKSGGIIWKKEADDNNKIQLICNSSTKLEFQIYDGSIQQVSIESSVIVLNRLYEVIIRIDETNQVCDFYLDKILQGEDTGFTLPDTSGADLILGVG